MKDSKEQLISKAKNQESTTITVNVDKRQRRVAITFAMVLISVVLVGLAGFILFAPNEEVIVGQMEIHEVRISGKVPGRITSYYVEEGQEIHAGDTLVHIYSPEVLAKLQQAEAVRNAAEAMHKQAKQGTSKSVQSTAYQMWQSARVGLDVARKSFNRVKRLYDEGVISAQKFDEVSAKYASMQATEKAARSQYQLSQNGIFTEGEATSQALLDRTNGLMSEVDAYLEESVLTAPVDGVITDIYPQEGELVGSGAPIMSIAQPSTVHVLFAIREDKLGKIKRGSNLIAHVPALNNQQITLRVTKLKDMGTYAAWKATKPTEQIDVRTFEVTAIPIEVSENFVAGMSVVLNDDQLH